MQQRPSSRLLVINRKRQVLLFRFEHRAGPLTGHAFWATPGGDLVQADEWYFAIQVGEHAASDANWTVVEREVAAAHRWWGEAKLQSATAQVWPENLTEILSNAGIWRATA